ncbi:DUF736 family protein [Campylobacter devanensis]|uniref:DUF736 family protein n=1 Tax=Campylobacter devanensis TaxID=3161138 RepID=UPI000A35345B|nr:DUF736 family protein [Campylobacter sp. P0107]
MKIGYITQKSFTQADEIVKYLCGSMQILGVANMLEFTITPANSDNPNSPTYYIKLPRLKSNLASNIIIGSLWLRTSQSGNEYMSGYIDSPIFSGGRIEIICFKPYAYDNPAILWNIIWEPHKKSKEPDSPTSDPAPKATLKQIHSQADDDVIPF